MPLPHTKREARVLADWVAESIREAILQGYFKPGERLDQDLIADELAVSRTPLREALKSLESDGFIEVRPHYGAFVAKVTAQDIREIYETRALLEAEIVRQVTPLIPESALDELEASLSETQAHFDAGNIAKHFESDVHFHDVLASYVENRLLKEMLDSLFNRICIARRFAQSKPGTHLVESFKEHNAILHAVRRRDAKQAAELMRRHLEESSVRVQELAEQSVDKT